MWKTISTTIIITVGIILSIGVFFDIRPLFTGDWGIEEVEEVEEILDEVVETATSTYDEMIKTNLMLNYVIDCESSGRHEGIWGQAGEYGILQYQEKSFYWLADKYNFTGEWKNKDDQIELFLLLTDEERYTHWTCVKRYYK